MTHLPSLRVLGIDLSYRETGYAVIEGDGKEISLLRSGIIQNEKLPSVTFDGLWKASLNMRKTIVRLNEIADIYKPDVMVCEVPCFTQTAKSAILIGMMWSAASGNGWKLIDPDALKEWSDSKRGDKKEAVAEKVKIFFPNETNNNIIDAIGICLMTLQLRNKS